MDLILRILTVIEQHPEIFTKILDLFTKVADHNPGLLPALLGHYLPPPGPSTIHWGDGPTAQPPASPVPPAA